MFPGLKERFAEFREFSKDRGIRWTMSIWCRHLVTPGWLGTITLAVMLIGMWSVGLMRDPLLALLWLGGVAFLSLLFTIVALIANWWTNIPHIIAFLRDPTYENE